MDSAFVGIDRERREAVRGRIRGRREREREREIPTGHEESISTHIHGTNSRVFFFFFFFFCGLFYFTLLDGLCVKKHLVPHAIRSQTLSWTVPRLEAARMCLESTSLT